MIDRRRPSRDYDPNLKIESVTRYVTVMDKYGENARIVPVSVARLKFLEKKDDKSHERPESRASCRTLEMLQTACLSPDSGGEVASIPI